jgi:hypothetical protein
VDFAQVVTVRYSDWQRLRTDAARQEHLWRAIEAALEQAPGADILRMEAKRAKPSAWDLRRWWRLML